MKNSTARLPFILSAAAFVCFLIVAIGMEGAVRPLRGRTAVLLLPSVILFAVAVLSRKGRLSEKTTAVLTAVLTVILLLLSIVWTFLLYIWSATGTVTDIRYYPRAYRRIEAGEGVRNVFPKTVPEDAGDVEFSYTPRFLQGGEEFRLSFRSDENGILEWSGRLQDAAEWVGSNNEWLRTHNRVPHETDVIRYQLFWDGGSNHGELCYALIDRSDQRIGFYRSEW